MNSQAIATVFIAILTCASAAFTYLSTGKAGKVPSNQEIFVTLRQTIEDLNDQNTELIMENNALQAKLTRLQTKHPVKLPQKKRLSHDRTNTKPLDTP